jgi:hypothetical protein
MLAHVHFQKCINSNLLVRWRYLPKSQLLVSLLDFLIYPMRYKRFPKINVFVKKTFFYLVGFLSDSVCCNN